MLAALIFAIFCAAVALSWHRLAQFFGSGLIAVALVPMLLLGSCVLYINSGGIEQVRFRVTATVEVNGQRKTTSAVQAIDYQWRRYAGNGAPFISGAFRKGSAPLFDLGPHGMLAVSAGSDHYSERQDQTKRGAANCADPRSLHDMFNRTMRLVDDANAVGGNFKRGAKRTADTRPTTQSFKAQLAAMPKGIQVIDISLLPAFIWFPPQSTFMASRLVCPNDLWRVSGETVEFKSVTIEVVPNSTPIDLRLTQPGPWMAEMRQIMNVAPNDRYKINDDVRGMAYRRLKQLEPDTWK